MLIFDMHLTWLCRFIIAKFLIFLPHPSSNFADFSFQFISHQDQTLLVRASIEWG